MERMPLRDWARRKNRELNRKSLEDRDARLWHSRAYHDYFEGYVEREVTDARGKTRIRRVYAGTWYVQDLPRGRYVLLRILYVLLFAGMAGALVLAGLLQGGAGTAFYVVLPEIVTVCLLARLFYALFVCYLFAPKRMTIHDYRSSSGALNRTCVALTAAFLVCACATLAEALLRHAALGGALAAAAAFALGALLAGAAAYVEKKTPYKELPNGEATAENGTPIER